MASIPSSALPGLERVPGKQNWIEKLPAPMRAAWHRSIIYRAAKHMAAKGMPVGMAIASANNWAEHICHTGDVKQWKGPQAVKPTSVAECCAARTLWNTMRATSHADTSIPAEERREIDLTFQLVDHLRDRIDLASKFTEALHPRVGKGKTGGGRFAKKGGDNAAPSKGKGIRPKFQFKTKGTKDEKTAHRHARDILYGISGVKKGGLTATQMKNRRQASNLSVLARRWNAQSREKRIAAMKAFLGRQATLPKGWSFDSEGRLHIDTNLSEARVRRIIELARYAIFGPRIDLAPSMGERIQAAKKGQALPGKNGNPPRFPITDADSLDKAIHAVGRARPNTEEERAKVRRFIISRAKALGLSSRIPSSWNADGSLKA
jgi:hypothetical protein